MNYKVLNSRERKRFWKEINEQFSSNYYPETAVLLNKDKYFIVNESIHEMPDIKIYHAGVYFAKRMLDGLRPTIEGSQLLGKTAKSVLKLDNEQINEWIKGLDLPELKIQDGFYLIKNNTDFYGCGKIKQEKLFNYVPKARRLINIHEIDSTSLA